MSLAALGVAAAGNVAGSFVGSLLGGEDKRAEALESLAQDLNQAWAGFSRHVNLSLDALKKEGTEALDSAFNDAITTSQSGVTDTIEMLDPFRVGGLDAFREFLGNEGLGPGAKTPAQLEEEFLGTPGVQFQMDQGRRAIESSASSRGLLGSGRVLKELERFGQGVAAQRFGETQGRLLQAAQVGGNIALQTGNILANQNQATANLQAREGEGKANLISQAEGARANFFGQQANTAFSSLINLQGKRAEKGLF